MLDSSSHIVGPSLRIDAFGLFTYICTVVAAVDVHPFIPVTVTVKVPSILTVVVWVAAPLLQTYVPPPEAVRVTLDFAHVMGPSLETDTLGAVKFWVTNVDAEAVHPFSPVTVTVYVPDEDTTFVGDVPPPVHTYVPPPEAVRVTLALLQVRGPSLETDTLGTVKFWVTTVDAEAVHPFSPVTVTVYVPDENTTFVDDVPPPVHTYVPPPEAVRVTLALLQVMGPALETDTLGTVKFWVTNVDAEAVHPFSPVTVTVYVPDEDTTFVGDVPPPVHTYVPPPEAVRVTLALLQVMGPSLEADTLGTVKFWVTTVDAEAVHPFSPVTVTVYVPDEDTTFVGDVPPPVHTYVPPPEAVRVTLALLQVMGPSLEADTLGTVKFWVTNVDAEAVHPFSPVTVTVYVPDENTTFVGDVPPPDHT